MLLEQFERLIGLESLCLLHLNDAKVAAAPGWTAMSISAVGRSGGMVLRTAAAALARGDAVILETPDIGSEWDRRNLKAVRSLLL